MSCWKRIKQDCLKSKDSCLTVVMDKWENNCHTKTRRLLARLWADSPDNRRATAAATRFFVATSRHLFPTCVATICRWAPASRSFFRAPVRTREFILLIITWHTQQTGSAFSARVTTCNVWVRVSLRRWLYLIHSPAGYRLPESKLFLMRTKSHIAFFTTITDILSMKVDYIC